MNNGKYLKVIVLILMMMVVPLFIFSTWYNQRLIEELNEDVEPSPQKSTQAVKSAVVVDKSAVSEEDDMIIITDLDGEFVKKVSKTEKPQPEGDAQRTYMMPETSPTLMQ